MRTNFLHFTWAIKGKAGLSSYFKTISMILFQETNYVL